MDAILLAVMLTKRFFLLFRMKRLKENIYFEETVPVASRGEGTCLKKNKKTFNQKTKNKNPYPLLGARVVEALEAVGLGLEEKSLPYEGRPLDGEHGGHLVTVT